MKRKRKFEKRKSSKPRELGMVPDQEVTLAAQRCWEEIKGDIHATTALNALDQAGVDPGEVLAWIEQYAEVVKIVPSIKNRLRAERLNYKSLGKKLRRLIPLVEEAKKKLATSVQELDQPKLATENLPRIASLFESAGAVLAKPRIVGGPHALYATVSLVTSATGRPHYREISEVLRARMRAVLQADDIPDEESLRKAIRDLRQKEPDFTSTVDRQIREKPGNLPPIQYK
jgi:hypothetical protein